MLRSLRILIWLVLVVAPLFEKAAAADGDRGAPAAAAGQLFRSVDDPALNTRWLLLRNPEHPGAPGRMVEAHSGSTSSAPLPGTGHGAAKWQPASSQGKAKEAVLAGEEILLVSESPGSQLALYGRALSAGRAGDAIEVRLDVFQTKVHARLVAPGRAEMLASPTAYGSQR